MKDERITSLTNTFAAKAGVFLAYYITLSVVVKGFIIDTPFFLYWDVALAMVLAGIYVIYRSASKGVPVEPATGKLLDKKMLTGFGYASVILGIFVVFLVVPMHETWPEHFPGFTEKIFGVLIIGVGFFVIMAISIWLMDYIPTKLAFSKSKELIGEEDDESTFDDFVNHSKKLKDERIQSTLHEYAAHGLYFIFAYILISTLAKIFTLDIPLWHYYDVFIAAMLAGGYFTIKMLRAGIFVTGNESKKDRGKLLFVKIFSYLFFGFFMTFFVTPSNDIKGVNESLSSQIVSALLLSLLFGGLMLLFEKLYDSFSNRNANRLTNDE